MNQNTHFVFSLISSILASSLNAGFAQTSAEDLWGNKINIQNVISGITPTVIVPFSTSNCGYCLVDGYYIEKNYIGNNEKSGGKSFHMSLFNPQLDIYSFQKHFKWTGAILTSPITLHKYHEDGFPAMLAFKNGRQLLKEFYNYAKFDTLKTLLWDTGIRLIPTGEKHIADAFIYENQSDASVVVYPKGTVIPDEMIRMALKYNFSCKHIDELTSGDFLKHLKLKGGFDFQTLCDFFPENSIPVDFMDHRIFLGNYSFDFDSTGIYCCFPSPFNREKYIVLEQNTASSKLFSQVNSLDYILFTGNTKDKAERLLYGHFDKSTDYQWKFDDDLAFSDVEKSIHCLTKCRLPEKRRWEVNPARDIPVLFRNYNDHDEWIIGNENCRFPDITSDTGNGIWIVWEESGDIGLLFIDKENNVSSWFVENDESDSYNPQVVVSGSDVWIFYLNNRDGYYRLYGRSFDRIRFSDMILISEKGPFDAVTPDAASNGKDEITVAWSEWKANYRYLKSRQIKSGVLEEIKKIKTVSSIYTEDYTNAWYPSILYDVKNEIWGAWNQHYPATFGVCGGKFNDTAISITQTAKKMDDWENGGYPCLFPGYNNQLFVAWESSAWEAFYGDKQKIKVAEYNHELKKWSLGKVISLDKQTKLCQTPSGICDKNGNKYIVWSGRPDDENQPWGLYLVKENNGKWNVPVFLSDENENDRHPKITIDQKGMIWISCHTGIGDNMKVKVMKLGKDYTGLQD